MRGILVSGTLVMSAVLAFGQSGGSPSSIESQRALVGQYCVGCHNDKVKSGSFSWTQLDLVHPDQNAQLAEKAIRKLRSGLMPPPGARRPDTASLKALASGLETRIDQVAMNQPHIDAPDLHRVNRTEYHNSVRDLLGIDVDVTSMLPPDARSNGFDNMSDALTITPALMQGYIRAAEKISREAVGDPTASAAMLSYNVPKVINQMRHIEGAPFGTRGGISVKHTFPADGEYSFRLELYYNNISGSLIGSQLPKPLQDQQVEVSVDGERVAVFTIDPDIQEVGTTESALITDPIKIKAGQRRLSAAFVSKFEGPTPDQIRLVEQLLMDTSTASNPQMTLLPHLRTLSVTGPFNVAGVSDTTTRRRIFTCRPAKAIEEERCATQIITRLAKQAFRRPVNADDLEALMTQYQAGRKEGDFETGIRTALEAILAKPEFVFRFERVPTGVKAGASFRISDLELASRLAYFLWSSIPDDQLITLASQGKLKDNVVLEQQVKRMLADVRSQALSTSFARQWLRLQGIQDVLPETTKFPDFTKNLGESMSREVELLFANVVREDRNIVDMLTADYTFVDEVLAKHYGISDVLGFRFRRVQLTDPNRFGLVGKAGILTITSLANRTSPVARGKYVLEVLLGTPPPSPPANVPPLKESVENEKVLTVRERLEQHRTNEPCHSCHQIMDPIGMALENFDAIGLWRVNDGGSRIDPSGVMYNGTKLDGPASVREAVLSNSDAFVGTFTENLLAYALGRVLDHRDMPTVRSIVRDAMKNNNRASSFVMGIVKSAPFQMRTLSSETQQNYVK